MRFSTSFCSNRKNENSEKRVQTLFCYQNHSNVCFTCQYYRFRLVFIPFWMHVFLATFLLFFSWNLQVQKQYNAKRCDANREFSKKIILLSIKTETKQILTTTNTTIFTQFVCESMLFSIKRKSVSNLVVACHSILCCCCFFIYFSQNVRRRRFQFVFYLFIVNSAIHFTFSYSRCCFF